MTLFWIFDPSAWLRTSFGFCIGRIKRARIVLFALCALLHALCVCTEAQQPTKLHRIGVLAPRSEPAYYAIIEAFRRGMRELGYIEGKNVLVEYRYPENNFDSLALELVHLKVDLIFTGSQRGVRAVKQATGSIPIVMVTGDAVRYGFIASLSRPAGNVTGLSFLSTEVRGKQLEILKEAFPKISSVAVLLDPAMISASSPDAVSDLDTARQIGLQAHLLEVRSSDEFDGALKAATARRAGAFLVWAHPLFVANRQKLVALASKSRLPTMYPWKEFVEDGGLMSYGPNLEDLYRRAASYVDKILKGAKPADLPVEQPTKFEFIVNLKAAKQIGLTIPPNVLVRADKVIK